MRKLPDWLHQEQATSNIAPLSWQNETNDARIQGQNFVLDATRFLFNSSHSHYDCPPSHPTVVDWYPFVNAHCHASWRGPTPPL